MHDLAVAAEGAISGVAMLRKASLREIFGRLFVGTVTAVHIGPAAAEKFATNRDATIYLTGVAGWALCWLAISIVKSKMPAAKKNERVKE
jgi:hypothetical protein